MDKPLSFDQVLAAIKRLSLEEKGRILAALDMTLSPRLPHGQRDFETFALQVISKPSRQLQARVISSPAGRAVETLALDADQRHLLNSLQTLGIFSYHARDPQIMPRLPEPDLRRLGVQLFRTLFTGTVLTLWDKSRQIVEAEGDRGLRLQLQFGSRMSDLAWLKDLPWELMFHSQTGAAIVLDPRTAIIRQLDIQATKSPSLPPLSRPWHVLTVSTMTESLGYDLDEEERHVEALGASRPDLEIMRLTRPGFSTLKRAILENSPHIIHFIGHGAVESESGRASLIFQGPQGGTELMDVGTLAAILGASKNLRLAVLNTCQTSQSRSSHHLETVSRSLHSIGETLVKAGLPAVVEMKFPVSSHSALVFSRRLYTRLMAGDPLEAAVTEGRLAISALDPNRCEWASPVLFLRRPPLGLFEQETRSEAPQESKYIRWLKGSISPPRGTIESQIDQLYPEIQELIAQASVDPSVRAKVEEKRIQLRHLQKEEAEAMRSRAEERRNLQPGLGYRLLERAEKLLES